MTYKVYKMMTKVGCKVMKMMMFWVEMRIMTCTVQVMLLTRWVRCRIRRILERARTAGVQWQST
jgi:hypothetical protein